MRIVSSRARHKKIMFVECINHCLWTTKRFSFGGKNRDITGREQDHISGAQCTPQTDRSVGSSLPQEYHLKYALLDAHLRNISSSAAALRNVHFVWPCTSEHPLRRHYTLSSLVTTLFQCWLRLSLHFSLFAETITTLLNARCARHYSLYYSPHPSLHFSILYSLVTTLFNVDFAPHYPLNPIFTHHYAFQCSLRQSL